MQWFQDKTGAIFFWRKVIHGRKKASKYYSLSVKGVRVSEIVPIDIYLVGQRTRTSFWFWLFAMKISAQQKEQNKHDATVDNIGCLCGITQCFVQGSSDHRLSSQKYCS